MPVHPSAKNQFYICYIRLKQSRDLYSKICQIKIFGVAFLALNARRENNVLTLYDNTTLFYIPLSYIYSLKQLCSTYTYPRIHKPSHGSLLNSSICSEFPSIYVFFSCLYLVSFYFFDLRIFFISKFVRRRRNRKDNLCMNEAGDL